MRRKQMGGMVVPILLAGAPLAGCSKAVENNVAPDNMAGASSVEAIDEPDAVRGEENMAGLPTDEWLGRWTGPEGLFLDIQPSPDGKTGHYAITNRDTLDREANYNGAAEGEAIRITRDGKELTIRNGTGAETGFKYFAGKQDCLIVVAGQEGFCR